jgi:hypothetical protein
VNLDYPTWQKPLAAAILEFNPQQLPDKLQRAEEAIATRLEELRLAGGTGEEVRLLIDGLSIIRGIKQDRLSV